MFMNKQQHSQTQCTVVRQLLGVCTRSFLSTVMHCAAVCGPALAQCRPACSLVRSGFSVHGSKGNALIAQCIQLSLFFLYLLFARQQYGARAGPHSLAWLPYSRLACPASSLPSF